MYKKLFEKRNTIIYKWFFSYMIILVFPLILTFFMYYNSRNIVIDNTIEANNFLMIKLQENIDGLINNAQSISYNIVKNTQMAEFFDKSDFSEKDIEKIGEHLKTYKASYPQIDDFYVYFKNSDLIINSIGYSNRSKDFYDIYYKNSNISYEQWYDSMLHTSKILYSSLNHKDSYTNTVKTNFYYALPSFVSSQSNNATIVAVIDSMHYDNQFKDIYDRYDASILILDSMNNVIFPLDGVRPVGINYDDFYLPQSFTNKKINNEKVILSHISSRVNGWKYISITPYDSFWKQLGYVGITWLVTLGLSILVGIISVLYLLKNNYKPVKNIVGKLQLLTFIKGEKVLNEYDLIENAISSAIDEQERISDKLEKQNDEIKKSLVTRLLMGSIDTNKQLVKEFSEYNVEFCSQYFAVVIFELSDYKLLFFDDEKLDSNQRLDITKFIVSNISVELANENGYGYIVDIDNQLVLLVNIKPDSLNDVTQILKSIVMKTRSVIEEHFEISIHYAISNIHENISNIPLAYHEAVMTIKYKTAFENPDIIFYNEVNTSSSFLYYFPIDKEIQFINWIKSGNYVMAKSIAEQIIVSNKSPNMSVYSAKCFLYDILCTILKTSTSIGYVQDEKYNSMVESFFASNNISEMHAILLNILSDLCDFAVNSRQSSKSVLLEKINKIISNKYKDPNLTVSSLSYELGLDTSYLSRTFKEFTGENLLDCIHRYKIDKAKNLLESTDITIEEIAISTGFTNANTFTRVFKKIEGIPPGQYKSII